MLFIHTHRLSRAPTERRGRVDGASFPQEGPEPEPYQPGHDEQRDKQKRPLLVGVRWHRIHCKGLKRAGAPRIIGNPRPPGVTSPIASVPDQERRRPAMSRTTWILVVLLLLAVAALIFDLLYV